MKRNKWKLINIIAIITMFSTMAGFEFYPQMAAASSITYESRDIMSGAAYILDEIPQIPESISENTVVDEEVLAASYEEELPNETTEENDTESMVGTLIIADVSNYVNIRSVPGEDGEILGKLYDDSVGTLLDKPLEWLYIESGSVRGYVKAEFVKLVDYYSNTTP